MMTPVFFSFAFPVRPWTAVIIKADKMAMMEITTINSIKVKPLRRLKGRLVTA
jgi:hypothetical protein